MENTNIENSSETIEPEKAVGFSKKLLAFWLRMIGWLAAGVVAPIITFSIEFGLFTEYGYQVTTDELGNVVSMQVALNGWGIVSVALIGFAAVNIINEIIDAYTKEYSLLKQILVGVKNKILPIVIAIVVCYFLKNCVEQIIFCLTTIGICQIVAIPLNPLPKWKSEKKGEEDYSDLLSGFVKLIKDKTKNNKGGN